MFSMIGVENKRTVFFITQSQISEESIYISTTVKLLYRFFLETLIPTNTTTLITLILIIN